MYIAVIAKQTQHFIGGDMPKVLGGPNPYLHLLSPSPL